MAKPAKPKVVEIMPDLRGLKPDRKKIQLNIWIEPQVRQLMRVELAKENRQASAWVEAQMIEYLKAKGIKVPKPRSEKGSGR